LSNRMVKNLKDLKVAEIRTELNSREEDSKGRKAEIKQRLSDWLEDNDFDPDYYDFETKSEILPDNEIPGLESVPEENTSEKHQRTKSADKISPKTSQMPSRKTRVPQMQEYSSAVITLDDSIEEDAPEIDLTEESESHAELEELNKKIADFQQKIHLSSVARGQLQEQVKQREQQRVELAHEEKCLRLAAEAATVIKNKAAVELATLRANILEARRVYRLEITNKEHLLPKLRTVEIKLQDAMKTHERNQRELDLIEEQVDLDNVEAEEEPRRVGSTMPSRNKNYSSTCDFY